MRDSEIEEAGRLLAGARREGRLLARSECDLRRIGSLEEAEAIQDEAATFLRAERIGYSLAATTRSIARQFGCPQPLAGPLMASERHLSGSQLRVTRGMLGIATQLSFTFGRCYPVDGETLSAEAIRDAIASCHVGLQVLARRTTAETALNEWVATADFGLAETYVEGTAIPDWRDLKSGAVAIQLRVDGHVCASVETDEPLQGPLTSLLWLARRLRARGRMIEAGDIVTTGASTTLLQVTPGHTVTGCLGTLSAVEVHLV